MFDNDDKEAMKTLSQVLSLRPGNEAKTQWFQLLYRLHNFVQSQPFSEGMWQISIEGKLLSMENDQRQTSFTLEKSNDKPSLE